MPAPFIEQTAFALPTTPAPTTLDITIAGFGTPEAVMFLYGGGLIPDNFDFDGRTGFGFTDGVSHFAGSRYSQNGVATSSVHRVQATTSCIVYGNWSSARQGVASFNSWITDGVRLNIDATFAEAWYCTAIFFRGGMVYAEVFDTVLSDAAPVNTILTGQGAPNLVFVGYNSMPDTGDWNRALSGFGSFGFASDEDGVTQRHYAWWEGNGLGTTSNTAFGTATAPAGECESGAITHNNIIQSFGVEAGGEGRITWAQAASTANGDRVGGLALRFTDAQYKVFTANPPGGTPVTYTETTPGFEPGFGMMIGGEALSSFDFPLTAGPANSVDLVTFTADEIHSHCMATPGNRSTTVTRSQYSPTWRWMRHSGGDTYVRSASHVFTPTGWTFELDQSARFSQDYPALAIEVETGVVPTAAITGSVVPNATETEIVNGGQTIDITLTDDTWVSPFDDTIRQAIIEGLESDGVEASGWNAEVRDKEVPSAVNRASNTLVRVTLSASPLYDITTSETITVTVPASALQTSTSSVVGTPTFDIVPSAVAGVVPGGLQSVEQQVMPFASTRLGGVLE